MKSKNKRFGVKKICLNGYWNFLPVYDGSASNEIPAEGWISGKYIVPSPWNKSFTACRRKGEKYFTAAPKESIRDLKKMLESLGDEPEFLFDGFGYPLEWTAARSGWLRKKISLSGRRPGRKYFLELCAAAPRFKLFVNGRHCGSHYDPLLPFEEDVTGHLREGDNEIAVLIEDHLYDESGRTLAPSGNMFTNMISGIWQDVYLVERGDIHVSDLKIVTSTRKGCLEVEVVIVNGSPRRREVLLKASAFKCQRSRKCTEALKLPEQRLALEPQAVTAITLSAEWPDAEWWSPENPALHILEAELHEGGRCIDSLSERFGFREVWIEGRDIMLNDHPVHIFSDWGHKCSPFHLTESWIRKWYGMIKDCNMNHSRLHTHPHPEIFLDLADEMGIMITGETGIHGSGGVQASDSPEFWKNAESHVRNFIRRDRNHPSLIMWSVENEMRWNRSVTKQTFETLPRLRKLFNELDPTRPAYHEGDSSLWDESTQEILSRHYGKECSGEGWWDGKRPLHSGEMCPYHYAGPNSSLHIAGDEAYADYDEIDRASAIDTALVIEAGRAKGVCCFGPWNISCHQNLRPCPEKISLNHSDFEAPGVKPLQVLPHSSEFEFWKNGRGYYPNRSFSIQKKAFRPFAVIDTSLKSTYFAGELLSRRLTLVNDTSSDISGRLSVSITSSSKKILESAKDLTIVRGGTSEAFFHFKLPSSVPQGKLSYCAEFKSGDRILDSWSRRFRIAPRLSAESLAKPFPREPVAVIGKGTLEKFLSAIGADFAYFKTVGEAVASRRKIILAERNSLSADADLISMLRTFTSSGGRLLAMEQISSIFPEMPIEAKPVMKAFIRTLRHPILKGIEEEDLFMWGEDSFANPSGNSNVAENLYRKHDEKHSRTIIDSGEGGFGDGDIEYSALLESRPGKGLVLACQLRLTDKLESEPAAERLIFNMLDYVAKYKTETNNCMVLHYHPSMDIEAILPEIRSGKTLYVEGADEGDIIKVNRIFGTGLQLQVEEDQYQAVRTKSHNLLDGVSNWDTCGIEMYCYSNPKTCENFRIGRKFIVPCEGFTTLLGTASKSGLKELFVHGGRTELLRSHTVSKFVYGKKPGKVLAVMGFIKVGKGRVLISQFSPESKDKPRMMRLKNRLMENCGENPEGTLFDGKFAESEKRSGGFPTKAYVLNRDVSAEELERLKKCTVQGRERLLSTAMLEIAGWAELKSDEGIFGCGGLDLSREIFLYHHLFSPSMRKNLGSNLWVPNPEALTFLDVTGEGSLEVTINGESRQALVLDGGTATVSDIPLEISYNHVLFRWKPSRPSSTLKFRWRNIMRKPETGLGF